MTTKMTGKNKKRRAAWRVKSRAKRANLKKSVTLRDVVGAAMDNGMTVKVGMEPLGTSREEIQKAIDAAAKPKFTYTASVRDLYGPECSIPPEVFENFNRAFKSAPESPADKHAFGETDLLNAWRAVRAEDLDYLLPGHRVDGYRSLEGVLFRAYDQASRGKGAERHGRGLSFDQQPTQNISDLLDSDAGLAFQAIKKVNEGMRLEHDPKIKEMLGAINYIASIVIRMERNKK